MRVAARGSLAPSTAAAGAARRRGHRRWLTGYVLCLPALLVMLGLIGYPVVYNLVLSLTGARDFASSGRFVGFANYQALFGDPRFWTGVRYLAVWVPVVVAVELLVGLATALLLWWRFWGRTLLFLAVFIPWAFPSAFSAFAWYALFVPPFLSFYTHQAVLLKFWLDDHFGPGTMDFLAYGVMSVWRISSIMAIVLLAGLNSIPRDLLDYARLEARNPLAYLWQAVLPMVRRYLVLVVMVGIVVTFMDYDSIYLESGQRSIVPVFGTVAYQHGIMLGDTGYAAALNVVSLPLLLLVAIVGLRWVGPDRPPRSAPHDDRWVPSAISPESVRPNRRTGSPGNVLLPRRWRRRLLYAGGALAAILIAAFHLFPVYFVYVQAVRPIQELSLAQPFLAYHPDFSNFHDAVVPGASPMWLWARNTLIAFGTAILIGVSLSMLAGYGLARFRPPGASFLAKAVFACLFVPQFAVILPLYQVYAGAGLDNSIPGLVLLYVTMVIPFSTWLYYAYFQGLDVSVEEHSWLDANKRQTFVRVVVPMSRPIFIAAALFGVGVLGSDIVYAATLALSDSVKTLPVALGMSAISLDEWANVSADVLLASLPLVLLCAALGRSFVQGIQAALLEGA